MSDFRPQVEKLDAVNYTHAYVPSDEGPMRLEGMTVRAMRVLLEKADPDAMVVYIAEQNNGLLYGCIAGAGMDSPTENKIVVLFGPEGVRAISALGVTEL